MVGKAKDILGTKRYLSKATYFTAKFVTILRLDHTSEVEQVRSIFIKFSS